MSEPAQKKQKLQNQNAEQQRAHVTANRFLATKEEEIPEYAFDTKDQTNTPTAEQDAVFVKHLKSIAQPPITTDVFKERTRELRANTKNGILMQLPHNLQYPPRFDVQLASSHSELKTVLQHRFEVVRLAARDGLSPTHDWTIPKQVETLGKGSGQAYQPNKAPSKAGNTTHDVDYKLAHRIFIERAPLKAEEISINFLDIANLSPYRFAPDAIAEISLTSRIRRRQNTGSWAFTKADPIDLRPEWVIMTRGPSTSVWHADHAGYCTAVVGLEGAKFWYTVNGPWETTRKRFFGNGVRSSNYPQGITVTRVGPADCLIQAPGTPHAVVTPGDAMIAGCFFYTAAHFARSILCIRLHYEKKLHDNETIGARDFDELALIVKHLDSPELFSPDQVEDILGEIQELLLNRKLIGESVDGGPLVVHGQRPEVLAEHVNRSNRRGRASKNTRNNTKNVAKAATTKDTRRALELAEVKFLWACVDRWSSHVLVGTS